MRGAASLERLGAPAAIAYAQKLGDAAKDTGRVIANNFALNKANELREAVAKGGLATIDAADAFGNVTGKVQEPSESPERSL